MVKQYPLRVDETVMRKAKARAALEGISLKSAIEALLRIYGEGKRNVKKG